MVNARDYFGCDRGFPDLVAGSRFTVACARASIWVREKIFRERFAALASPWIVSAPVPAAEEAVSLPEAMFDQVSSPVVHVTAGSSAHPSRRRIVPSSIA